ncbi:MAG: ABC transporter ATP-binding protein [Candidatus Hydrogenedentes bacterium]|nr:ABC transporter ATP-binding protein [Candidatus Hydrogenedentota bacterium]
MKPAIVVEHVSKKYSRNANAHRSYSMTDLIREVFARDTTLKFRKDEFLALDHVSFHVDRGSSLAVIGRNGSGKTTLLKLLNGLTKLDTGTITLTGRVQALISLGVGFSPALSGRDNIYNSAALMGLNREETHSLFDTIVEFSELELFIDSPVGTYSSGMAARLGFSVAVHLRPDILLIDEVLSVGDYGFQNKCFVKMHELKQAGVTIVLVTHSHTHAIQLCEQALWLHEGKAMALGPAKETVQRYLDFLDGETANRVRKLNELKTQTSAEMNAKSNGSEGRLYGPIYDEFDRVHDLRVRLLVNGEETDRLSVHDELVIEYSFTLAEKVSDLNVTLAFFRKDGLKVNALSTLNGDLLKGVRDGEVRCRVTIPDFNLNPGHYVLVMPIHEGKSYLYRNVVREFAVVGRNQLTWEVMDFRYEYEVSTPQRHARRVSFPK